MKKRTIIIAIVLIAIMAIPTLATTGTVNKTLNYKNIKISLNGQTFTPKDATGKTVEPFIIDGTTYLPVRAVGEALGLTVGWDSATSTVTLENPNAAQSGQEIYNAEGIIIKYLGVQKSSSFMGDYDIKLSIQNNTEVSKTVQVREMSINGIMVNDIFSCAVAAGKTANDEITVYSTNGDPISNVKTAEFYFVIYDSDNFINSVESNIITINN